MKIRITDLSSTGLKVNDTIPLEALNERMNEAPGNDILFTADPEISITVAGRLQGAEGKGYIRASWEQPCARCMDNLKIEKNIPFEYAFKPLPHDPKLAEEAIDDVGIIYYSGEHLDLEGPVQETLILAIDPFFKPELDEDGACEHCGKNFCQKTVSAKDGNTALGDLLKKALKE